jgi:cation transport regulator
MIMPREKSMKDLPKGVEDLPEHAREIYREAHNNALEQYKDPKKRRGRAPLEEVVHKVAWAAVKKEYAKDIESGKWRRKKVKG